MSFADLSQPAIVASDLTKTYGGRAVVDHLSLAIHPGEIHGFLGLNGAGKTTTIRMLLGMVRPSSGSVRIFGQPVTPRAHAVWSDVGYLVETPYAYPELTVRENLELVRRLRSLDDPFAVGRVVERLDLVAYASQRAGTLSLGNAQRLGLAKALLHEPRLLVLDEPANALDPAGVVEVREMLRHLARDLGVTVFMSSHVLGEVDRLATRMGVIRQGRLVEEVDTRELDRRRRRWLSVDARDRRAAGAVLAAAGHTVEAAGDSSLVVRGARATSRPEDVVCLLVQAGTPPTRLAVDEEDLEAYFLRLAGTCAGWTLADQV